MAQPYSAPFRTKMVQRLVGPKAVSANQLAHEVGVHQSTLSRWLRDAQAPGMDTSQAGPIRVPSPRRAGSSAGVAISTASSVVA
jgi:transposase-like protein